MSVVVRQYVPPRRFCELCGASLVQWADAVYCSCGTSYAKVAGRLEPNGYVIYRSTPKADEVGE